MLLRSYDLKNALYYIVGERNINAQLKQSTEAYDGTRDSNQQI